jgi:D-alanyl-D-alanine carboxypeptidase
MSDLSDLVPLPPSNMMNFGLSACRESTMLDKFGKPGKLTNDCSPATGAFKARVKSNVDVGPFRVTGLDFAVESLRQIFDEVARHNEILFEQVKTAGMLCVRHIRHNPAHFSNHSWGCAIDLFYGADVVPQGKHVAHRGNLMLMPFFNNHGWFWGAGFSGDSVDSMHFELAEETVLKMPDLSVIA